MEFDIVPEIIIIIASGVIIFILGRSIPKLKDDASDAFWSGNYNEVEKREKEKFRYLYDKLAKRIGKEEYKKKMDLFWIWFEKVLRKARINFLKLDNSIVMLINKLREKNVEKIEKLFNSGEGEEKSGSTPKDDKVLGDEVRKFDWKNINKNADVRVVEKKKIEPQKPVFDIKPGVQEKREFSVSEQTAGIAGETDVEISEKIEEPEEIVENLGEEEKTNREKEYIDMIMKNPIDVKAYWHLGTIYARRRNYKDAIECFRQITKIDPTYEKAKHKLSEILAKMKKGVKRGKKGVGEVDEESESDQNMPT